MASFEITPARTIAVLVGVAIIVVVGFLVVRSGVFESEAVQEVTPGPGSSSSSASVSETSPSPTASTSPSPPSPTASPSPTTPGQVKAQNIADAKARLVEYYATTASVANNGYKEWESKLLPFWGHPDIRSSLRASYTDYAEKGDYTVGAARVGSLRLAGYSPDREGFETVNLRACIDFSDVKRFAKDGESIPGQAGAPSRYQFEYVMRHQGLGSVWTINEQASHPERAC